MNSIDNIITLADEKKINIIDITSQCETIKSESYWNRQILLELIADIIVYSAKNTTLKYPSNGILCYIGRNDKTEYIFKQCGFMSNYVLLSN